MEPERITIFGGPAGTLSLDRRTSNTEQADLYGYGKGSFGPRNGPVERVALDRLAPGFLDQPHQIVPPQPLGSGRTRIVINLFLDHRAVNIVSSEAQRDL